ncbi:EF-hand calcium-binding domain-containing protein 3-like [Myxocyprinus asiaticus]|uniref:EF-hand calcium-binding domain-containing protein 3-like n=1 Tax=Myxocyprinus asiaticus TaxID=70543 RepID=UPI0022232F82|nr:EF-hand calcium-binding domain-containing protein 3-like [Myxocyprinus asiaticus]
MDTSDEMPSTPGGNEAKYTRQDNKQRHKDHLKQVLDSLGIGRIAELEKLSEEPLTDAQIKAFKVMFELFSTHSAGCIDPERLSALMNDLHMKVNLQLLEETLHQADFDGDGRVGFQDFLSVMTDCQMFSRCLKDHEPDHLMKVSGTLFYDVLNKVMEAALIPSAVTGQLVRYYHKKSLYHVWRSAPAEHHQNHVVTYYDKAAHLVGLKPKQLMKYIQPQVQRKSPYSIMPCLTVRKEKRSSTKPFPAEQLDSTQSVQTRNSISVKGSSRPVTLKEKTQELLWRHWGAETKALITPVQISVDVNVKDLAKLTYDDIGHIRRKVREGVDSYLSSLSEHKQHDMWVLWRSLEKACGLQDDKTFQETFSTYSWSWSASRNLIQTEELERREETLH